MANKTRRNKNKRNKNRGGSLSLRSVLTSLRSVVPSMTTPGVTLVRHTDTQNNINSERIDMLAAKIRRNKIQETRKKAKEKRKTAKRRLIYKHNETQRRRGSVSV